MDTKSQVRTRVMKNVLHYEEYAYDYATFVAYDT